MVFLESTRSLYEKKLAKLLDTATNDSTTNGSFNNEETSAVGENGNSNPKNGEFSAEEEVTEEEDDQPSVVVRKAATPLRLYLGLNS